MIQTGGKNLSLTDKSELRKFGLLIASIFIAIGIISLLKGKDLNLYLIIIALIMFLFALVMPNLLSPIYKGWMKVGKVLGRVNSLLILSVIFYLVVTPIGFIFRMFKTNSKKFAHKSNKDSYWIKTTPSDTKEDMKRMF